MISIRSVCFSAVLAIFAAVSPQAFAAGITFTCNSDINTLATADGFTGNLCNTIQSTVGGAYASLFSNANANIYIEFTSDAGLGASTVGYLNTVAYGTYYNALAAHSSGDAVDTAALATLTSTEPSAFSSTNGQIQLTSALAQALGIQKTDGNSFNYVYGMTAPTTSSSVNGGAPSIYDSYTNCNVLTGSSTCYNGVIYLQDPGTISGGSQDYYYGQGTQTGSQYDIYSVIEHEADEILGTASCVDGDLTVGCNNNAAAVDLFRYTAPGSLAAFPTTNAAYFSYNGGTTNVAWYNHAANGQDYADFNSSSSGVTYNCTFVQDSEGCLGGAPLITNDGGAEATILDAVGFNEVSSSTPEPATFAMSGAGMALLALAGLRRRRG